MWEFLRGIEMKNRFLAILSALLILVAGSGIGAAAEIIVHPGESIQAAVDNAAKGDTIILTAGTYTGNVVVDNKTPDVIFMSQSGNPDDTIIESNRNYEPIISAGFETGLITIKGITIKGNGKSYGINMDDASCTAINCKFINHDCGIVSGIRAYIDSDSNTFINCKSGIYVGEFASIYGRDNTFIDCGEIRARSQDDMATVELTNSKEIHTDEQPVKPPVDNKTNNTKPTEPVPTPTEPGQPAAPSNNTTAPAEPAPTEPPVETPIEETGGSSGNSHHSSSGSSGGSHHSSSGGSGGTGGSPEDQKNVASKDTTKVFVPNEKQVTFNFTNNVTAVESISFTSKKTMGKITVITEDLKNKSSLVKDLPEGEIYKSFNVWVGNAGYGDSDNILNATIDFKVNQTWIKENNIDPDSIILYKYNEKDKKWIEIPVTFVGKDDQYVYYMANVPGYSSFVITGKAANIQLASEPVNEPVNEPITSTVKSVVNSTATKTPKESPGFGIITGIVCLLGVLHRIRGR